MDRMRPGWKIVLQFLFVIFYQDDILQLFGKLESEMTKNFW